MSPKGFLLTPGKLREYVTARGLVPDGRGISIRELGGGVSNLVFLVEGPKFRWVAKQSLEKLRVKDDWRSDRDRIYREAEAIQSLAPDRKSTRLNSSHGYISYAVFCLKKKKKKKKKITLTM